MSGQILPALAIGGSLLSAKGSLDASKAEARELRMEAAQLEVNAGQELAASQRRAMDERRQARIAASRARAIAAASGGGADDPTVVNAIADLEGEGEYRALSAMFEGRVASDNMLREAAANRRGAKSVKKAGAYQAAGSLLTAGATLYDRYAGKAPKGA